MPLSPVADRIAAVDALRGFALLGILVVNVFVFHAPYSHFGAFYGALEGGHAQLFFAFILLFPGKFVFIFSFLFGYGAYLQFSRWNNAMDFKAFWFRRMSLLAIAGILHFLLFWMGDILLSYALLGMALPWLLRLPAKTLLGMGILVYFTSSIYSFFYAAFDLPAVQTSSPYSLDLFIEVFSKGSFLDIFLLRMHEIIGFTFESVVYYLPRELGMFLVGIAAAKVQLPSRLSWKKHGKFIALVFVLALVWILFKRHIINLADLRNHPFRRPPIIVLNTIAEWLLGGLYILCFWLCCKAPWANGIQRLLAYAGKLALTNYILQSLVCVLVFYGFGLGQYGQWNPVQLLSFAFGVFLLQVLFSYLWFQRFERGPLESLWRKWSYKK